MLKNKTLVAKVRFDTADTKLSEVERLTMFTIYNLG